MEKILSIIVPTYNMEKYLERCLESLVKEPEVLEKLDVLVINDGSKDMSSAIAHRYSSNYPGSFTVVDKENGNYGSCVNAGLAVAKGQYVKILDADDYFESKNLNSFISFLETAEADLILSSYKEMWGEIDGSIIQFQNLPCKEVIGLDELKDSDICNIFIHSVTYKTAGLREMDYRQITGISYTDLQWVTEPISNVSTVQYFPDVVYNYVIGREGQTVNASVHCKSMWMENKVVLHLADCYEKKKSTISDGQRLFMYHKIKTLVSSIYNFYLNDYKDSLKESELVDFDITLNSISSELYNSLATEKIITKYFTFHYIENWRKKRSRNTLLFFLYDSYCSLRHKVKG